MEYPDGENVTLAHASDSSGNRTPLQEEVADRFGVLPNFFRLAADAPGVTENLWGFAKFGYLDNPLPSLFKERLFVYLSQFCEVRYCISRHVGFLVGLGQPAGDGQCRPATVEQTVQLLKRQLPAGKALEPHIAFLQNCRSPLAEMPAADTLAEDAIFACASHVFRQSSAAPQCLSALSSALQPATLQHLLVFLTFVRTAHFWTQVHPELKAEEDIAELLEIHEALAQCVLSDPQPENTAATEALLSELTELRKQRDDAQLLRVTLASIADAVIVTDPQGRITMLNAVAEQLTGRGQDEAVGQPLEAVLQIVDEQTRAVIESPAEHALRDGGVVGVPDSSLLLGRDGSEHAIEISAGPIRAADGEVLC